MTGTKHGKQPKSGDLVKEWAQRKEELQNSPSKQLWEKTHKEFLMERLNTRYFVPIEAIQACKENKGEGFSIVTIQCALIEFLAALRLGEGSNCSSENYFVFFFTGVLPGKGRAGNFAGFDGFRAEKGRENEGAKHFYKDVRCGLLHDAQTRDGWRIRASECDVGIDYQKKIVTRNQLTLDLKNYLDQYGNELKKVEELQTAFCKTFDRIAANICGEPIEDC